MLVLGTLTARTFPLRSVIVALGFDKFILVSNCFEPVAMSFVLIEVGKKVSHAYLINMQMSAAKKIALITYALF
jgi:hypothetical protein